MPCLECGIASFAVIGSQLRLAPALMLQTRYNVDQLLLNKALLLNPSHSNINIYILMTFIFELRVTLLGETSSQSFLGLND